MWQEHDANMYDQGIGVVIIMVHKKKGEQRGAKMVKKLKNWMIASKSYHLPINELKL